jgi:polyisoprenyl-teichoic acid--peptidoglycan teichoic acid transferase
LGIDRRTGEQTSWRTDVIQLITLNPARTKAVLTHIPRDVWADKYKINAVYNVEGPDAIKDQIKKITGQRPDRIIRVDFDAFVWAIDSVGGLTINVPNTFTDSSYPNDRNGSEELKQVTFEKGKQKTILYSNLRT